MSDAITSALDIPAATIGEALTLEANELQRFAAAARAVPPEQWDKAVAGTDWSIRALVAHVAGGYAAQAHLADLRRQIDPRMLRLYRHVGESLGDTIARVQIGDRSGRPPADVIRELEEVAPAAIGHRGRLFAPIGLVARLIPVAGRLPAMPLTPFAAVRDLWFHRLDLSEAAGLEMSVDSAHDRRILELLIRLAAPAAERAAGDRRVDIEVTSVAGGSWRLGNGQVPDVRIGIDPITLAKHLARRRSPAATRERATVTGDVRLATRVLGAMQSPQPFPPLPRDRERGGAAAPG